MAVGQLTHKSVTKYVVAASPTRLTKGDLRIAVREHAEELEFINLGVIGGTYFRLRELVDRDHSLEVRQGPGGRDLIGTIYWQPGPGTTYQYVVA